MTLFTKMFAGLFHPVTTLVVELTSYIGHVAAGLAIGAIVGGVVLVVMLLLGVTL